MDAPRCTGLALGDPPAAWAALGFVVRDRLLHLGGVTLHLTGRGGGILGWQLDPPAPRHLDGLPHVEVPDTPAVEHPNGVDAVDHLVVATDDHDRTAAALAQHDLHPRRTVDGARGDTATRYRFTLLGTCLLEVIGPVEPAGDGPARFVGLALTAPRLDGLTDLTGPARPAIQPGRQIVTLPRDAGLGVPVAVLTPRP